jgi:hypothetical protein
MAMTGLPETGEYRLSTVQLPASNLILEFVEFKGLDSARAPVPSRVQDPGSFRLQLTFRDIDITLAALKNAGGQVISTGAMPVRMTFGSRPWRLAVVPDPDNLFLIVQQGPLQRLQQEPAAAAKPYSAFQFAVAETTKVDTTKKSQPPSHRATERAAAHSQ